MRYKKISNYEQLTPIKAALSKYKEKDLSREESLRRLITSFALDMKDAVRYYNTISEMGEKEIKKLGDPGIDIKIYLYEKSSDDKETVNYPIFIEGSTSFYELTQINLFISTLVDIYNKVYLEEEEYPQFNIDIKTCNKDITQKETDLNATTVDQEVVVDDKYDDWVFGDDEDEYTDDDDESLQEIQEQLETTGLQTETSEKTNIKTLKLALGDLKSQSSNSVLDRLYEKDTALFKWTSSSTNALYTTKCQPSTRYPKVFDQTKKEFIDTKFPGSYGVGKKHEVSCDSDNLIKSNDSCLSIRFGSSEQVQNWYVCPRIWCTFDNVTLTSAQLIPGPNIVHPQKKCESFKPEGQINKEWRTCINCHYDIIEHDVKCPLCGRGILNKAQPTKPTATEALYIVDDDYEFFYPGFLNSAVHPTNIFTPCCFRKINNNVKEAFGQISTTEKISEYIQGWGKSLDGQSHRLGLLPPSLYSLFDMDPSKCKTGHLEYESSCFLRTGVSQASNSFFSALAACMGENMAEISANQLIDIIVRNIKVDDFLKLNNGNLDTFFRDSNPLITSFQNYIEYLLSNEPKDYRFFWNLLCRNFKWLPKPFNNGINIIIIEVNNEEGLEETNILCPYNFIYSTINEYSVILLKNDNIFEPIFLFRGKGYIPYRQKFKNTRPLISNILSNLSESCKEKVDKNIYNISTLPFKSNYKKSPIFDINLKLQALVTEGHHEWKPIISVIDNFNKIRAIITANNTYIPIYPSGESFIPSSLENRSIYNIPSKNLLSFSSQVNNLLILNKLLVNNNLEIRPLFKYVNPKNNLIEGIIVQSNDFIPVLSSPIIQDTIGLPITNKNIIDIDTVISNPAVPVDNKIKYTKLPDYYQVIKIISTINKKQGYISGHKDRIKIVRVYKPNINVEGLILSNNILIPIKPIESSNIPYDEGELVAYDFKKTVIDYLKLYHYSNYTLKIRPYRTIIDDNTKNITDIILETDTIIPIIPINILTKIDVNESILHLIPNINLNTILYSKTFSEYQNIYIDNRITTVKNLKYIKSSFERYRYEISHYLNYDPDVRDSIQTIIDKPAETIHQKRKLILPLIDSITSIIASTDYKPDNIFDENTIYDKKRCPKYVKSKTCNRDPFCVWDTTVETKLIRKKTDPVQLYKSEHRDTVTTEYKPVSNIDNQSSILHENEQKVIRLKEYIESNGRHVSDKFSKNISTILEIQWKKLNPDVKLEYYKKSDLMNADKRENIREEEGVGGKCLFYIDNEDIDNRIIFIKKITEELVRNKIKRREILEGKIREFESSTRFTPLNSNELILKDTDFKDKLLLELFKKYKKRYFRNIGTFDTTNPIKDKAIPIIQFTKPIVVRYSCNIQKISRDIKYNVTELTKQLSSTISSNLVRKIDSKRIDLLYSTIFTKNTPLSEYNVTNISRDIYFTLLQQKKLKTK